MKSNEQLVWYTPADRPDEVNTKHTAFMVDVLCYFEELCEHTIGFYDFKQDKWFFLCNQQYEKLNFKWRYFEKGIDTPVHSMELNKKNKKNICKKQKKDYLCLKQTKSTQKYIVDFLKPFLK